MPQTDWSLPELAAYRPDLPEAADLDDFWARTLAEARALAGPASYQRVDNGLDAGRHL